MSGRPRTPLGDVLDLESVERHVAAGMIARKVNADGFTLLNYTARAQYTATWDRETITCRGLVVAPDGTIQSRPFPKFWNVYEHAAPGLPDLPVEPFTVQEKVDGSLIIVSVTDDGSPMVTTRGAFDSEQAVAAVDLLPALPEPGVTWLLELVAPWNRIVVDHGDRTELVFLAAIDNATGADVDAQLWPGAVARTYDGLEDIDAIVARLATLGPDEEGFVIRYASGVRAKAKGAEYTRIHKLLTGLSARTIHDLLATGAGLDEVLAGVPDELYAWVRATADDLTARFAGIEAEARAVHDRVVGLPTRKDQALAIVDHPQKAVVFAMLDGKPHAPAIWHQLRPEADLTFTSDE